MDCILGRRREPSCGPSHGDIASGSGPVWSLRGSHFETGGAGRAGEHLSRTSGIARGKRIHGQERHSGFHPFAK